MKERKETVPSVVKGLLDSLETIGSNFGCVLGVFVGLTSVIEASLLQTQQKQQIKRFFVAGTKHSSKIVKSSQTRECRNHPFQVRRRPLSTCLICTRLDYEERESTRTARATINCDDSVVISEIHRRVSDFIAVLVTVHRRSSCWLLSFNQAVVIRILRKLFKCLLC